MEKRRRLRLIASYLPDWILSIALGFLFWGLQKVDGFRRDFSLTDTSLQYTYTVHERVPPWLLAVLSLVAPIILMSVINVATIRSAWDFHNSLLGLILSLSITGSITNIVKITVGRPRPDVIDRCQPRPGSVNAPTYGLVSSAICTQTNNTIMRDGWRSFPSGHSSLAFAGLGFLAFYLAGKLHLFDQRGHTSKAWISIAPFVGAALIAISRTMDYRHHWQDVLIGSILGAVTAYFSYRQYYPELSDGLSHRPYSPRLLLSTPIIPTTNAATTRYTKYTTRNNAPVTIPRRASLNGGAGGSNYTRTSMVGTGNGYYSSFNPSRPQHNDAMSFRTVSDYNGPMVQQADMEDSLYPNPNYTQISRVNSKTSTSNIPRPRRKALSISDSAYLKDGRDGSLSVTSLNPGAGSGSESPPRVEGGHRRNIVNHASQHRPHSMEMGDIAVRQARRASLALGEIWDTPEWEEAVQRPTPAVKISTSDHERQRRGSNAI